MYRSRRTFLSNEKPRIYNPRHAFCCCTWSPYSEPPKCRASPTPCPTPCYSLSRHPLPPALHPLRARACPQTSQNRFWMLPFLCKRWPGPISIGILEEDREVRKEHAFFCETTTTTSTSAVVVSDLFLVMDAFRKCCDVIVCGVAERCDQNRNISRLCLWSKNPLETPRAYVCSLERGVPFFLLISPRKLLIIVTHCTRGTGKEWF